MKPDPGPAHWQAAIEELAALPLYAGEVERALLRAAPMVQSPGAFRAVLAAVLGWDLATREEAEQRVRLEVAELEIDLSEVGRVWVELRAHRYLGEFEWARGGFSVEFEPWHSVRGGYVVTPNRIVSGIEFLVPWQPRAGWADWVARDAFRCAACGTPTPSKDLSRGKITIEFDYGRQCVARSLCGECVSNATDLSAARRVRLFERIDELNRQWGDFAI
jgi:hypothetical protein